MVALARPQSLRGKGAGPRLGWLALTAVCAVYASFALAAGLGLVEADKARALPHAFAVHAIAGSVALIVGALQFNRDIRTRFVRVHRGFGRIYVVAVCLAGSSAVANAATFDVGAAARLSFMLLGTLWLATTAAAYRLARGGDIARHRAWMLRSFALSLFFVTFSVWVPAAAAGGLDGDLGYAAAVTASWLPNLVVAEAWLRRTPARPAGP